MWGIPCGTASFPGSKAGALAIAGNELTVAWSVFKKLNQAGSDAGAVYNGRNPSETGIRIHHNYFQDIGHKEKSGTGNQGVYVDDRSSYVEVDHNVFNRVGSGTHAAAFKVNGGKHNRFHNNLVIDGKAAYIQVHKTDQDEWAKWFASKPIADKLAKVDSANPESPWARRYPLAYKIAKDSILSETTSNILENNVVIRGELVTGIIGGRYGDPLPTKSNDHVVDYNPGFRDLENDDLRIPARVLELEFPGFEWIDVSKMGIISQ